MPPARCFYSGAYLGLTTMKNTNAKQGFKVIVMAGFSMISDDPTDPPRIKLSGFQVSAKRSEWSMPNERTGATIKGSGYKPRPVEILVDRLPDDKKGTECPYPFVARLPASCMENMDGGKDRAVVFSDVKLDDLYSEGKLSV